MAFIDQVRIGVSVVGICRSKLLVWWTVVDQDIVSVWWAVVDQDLVSVL